MVDIRQIDPDAPRWTRLTAQLLIDEGRRNRIYADTATPPRLTGGVGHNFTDRPVPGIKAAKGLPLTDRQIADLFYIDRRGAIFDVATRIPFALSLAPARFDALANMAFNLGIGGLLKFRHLLAAMERGDWAAAVHELDDSIWSHQIDDGVGGRIGRADRIAQLITDGDYPAER